MEQELLGCGRVFSRSAIVADRSDWGIGFINVEIWGEKWAYCRRIFFFVNEIMCVTFVSKASFLTLDISNVVVVVVG